MQIRKGRRHFRKKFIKRNVLTIDFYIRKHSSWIWFCLFLFSKKIQSPLLWGPRAFWQYHHPKPLLQYQFLLGFQTFEQSLAIPFRDHLYGLWTPLLDCSFFQTWEWWELLSLGLVNHPSNTWDLPSSCGWATRNFSWKSNLLLLVGIWCTPVNLTCLVRMYAW